jgi:hypothetical protein
VLGLSTGSTSSVFQVGGQYVQAVWGGTEGSTSRTLTYTVATGDNGRASVDEQALKAALVAGLQDAAGNAFALSGEITRFDTLDLPLVDTSAPVLAGAITTEASTLFGSAGDSPGETHTLTLNFDSPVFGLNNGSIKLNLFAYRFRLAVLLKFFSDAFAESKVFDTLVATCI